MTSPESPLPSPSPCPPPPPSLPSSPTSPAPSSSLPPPPSLPPTGEVMVLALGRKKQRMLICLSILPNFFLAFLLSSDPLLTLASPHHCRLPGPLPAPQVLNASLPWEKGDRVGDAGGLSQCKQFINGTQSGVENCEAGWDYNVTEGLRNNIVTEWDLVCGQYWLVPVEEVCFILGVLTGCLGLGFAADRLGRLKTLLTSLTLSVVFGVLVCVSPSPPIFIVMRFCLAVASAGVYLTLYITRLELCDPSLRLLVTMLAGLTTFAGELLLLAVALGCQSWRGLLGAGAVPLSLFLTYGIPGVFPESPRWLLLSERSADLNSFSERRDRERDDESFTELDSEPPPSTRPHLSIPELVHSRNIWKNICVLGFTSFISHGISHCYSSFRGDVRGTAPRFYWTYLLSVCAGGGAWLLLWTTVDRCGRRGILLLSMTMTGLASLILLGLMEYLSEAAITVFSVMGLFSSQAAASLCILFTAEIMPTVIRGSGVGTVLALGCVGRLTSPLMDLRNHYGYFLHHVVYSSLALLAVLSILLLPESKRKPLPQTLADGELYRRPPLGRRRRDNVPLLATPNPET
ncbi:solute carrier family 22 member 17 [Esox lucius]|uniref:solute carrier family 22 member 17 n=1 Tax=Esox lucius TaxID=8010 RepID=UPI0005775CEE|nr:solute carrier family 22 member 17 [Esox lucius]